MRKRETDSIVGKLSGTPEAKHGRSVHVRPYHSDEKKLDEKARETGEGKAAIVRKMIRFALSDKQRSFGTSRCQDKLDWLVKAGRQNEAASHSLDENLHDILERLANLENDLETVLEISHKASIFSRELYCMSSVSVSSLNLILTRLLEFLSPNLADREQGVNIANGTMANLIAHAIGELDKCAAFHGIHTDEETAENLYLGTKIKVLQDRIAATPATTPEQQDRSK